MSLSLKNPEVKYAKNRLEELQDVITSAPERIESEFAKTDNDWLSCFGSSVFLVETYLFSPKIKELITPEKYAEIEEKIEKLKERLFELKDIYPDKSAIPPKEIKQELLSKLDILQ